MLFGGDYNRFICKQQLPDRLLGPWSWIIARAGMKPLRQYEQMLSIFLDLLLKNIERIDGRVNI